MPRSPVRSLSSLLGALLACALAVGCASGPPRQGPGWRTIDRDGLSLDAPPELQLVEVAADRFRLERAEGAPFMEARLSPWCPDHADGRARPVDGRFASPLGSLPGGQDRFFALLAGSDRCLLLRFFSLADEGERSTADRIAASARWKPDR